MSNLKVQTLNHVLGTVGYITTTKNSKKDLQIGVGNTPENFTKAVEIDSTATVEVSKVLKCPGITGYADYTQKSIQEGNKTIDEYYLNGSEFQVMLNDLYQELLNSND